MVAIFAYIVTKIPKTYLSFIPFIASILGLISFFCHNNFLVLGALYCVLVSSIYSFIYKKYEIV